MKMGYIQASGQEQNEALKVDALRIALITCDNIFDPGGVSTSITRIARGLKGKRLFRQDHLLIFMAGIMDVGVGVIKHNAGDFSCSPGIANGFFPGEAKFFGAMMGILRMLDARDGIHDCRYPDKKGLGRDVPRVI